MLQDEIGRALGCMSLSGDGLTEVQDGIREVDDLLTRFGSAVASGDFEGIRSCFSHDATCVFTGTTGRVRGQDEIVEVWSRHVKDWANVVVERSDTSVRIHGDTAWATFTWRGEGSAGGRQYVVEDERWPVVMLWDEGAWRFVQTHSSMPFTDWNDLEVTA